MNLDTWEGVMEYIRTRLDCEPRLEELLPGLLQAVKGDFAVQAHAPAHDLAHTLLVAQMTRLFADSDELVLEVTDAKFKRVCCAAGLLHNADRMYQPEEVEPYLRLRLRGTDFPEVAREAVVEAVLCHAKRNHPLDDPVTMVLKDVDRVANMSYALLRGGQFWSHLPTFANWNTWTNWRLGRRSRGR